MILKSNKTPKNKEPLSKTIIIVLSYIFTFFSSKINTSAFCSACLSMIMLFENYLQKGEFSWVSYILLCLSYTTILFRTFEKDHKNISFK